MEVGFEMNLGESGNRREETAMFANDGRVEQLG